jgi:hypothetical protein
MNDQRGYGRRPWIAFDEIERTAADALKAAGLWPSAGSLRVDIESLVEVHLGAVVDYGVDLDRKTLGYTVFDARPRVVVNRELTDLAEAPASPLGLRGRWRATLAHEAAHILLHRGRYGVGRASAAQTSPRGLAIEDPAEDLGPGSWREVQANMGMAALLMPRQPFLDEVRRLLTVVGPVFPPLGRNSTIAQQLIRGLAESFETSHQATELRLTTFGWLE